LGHVGVSEDVPVIGAGDLAVNRAVAFLLEVLDGVAGGLDLDRVVLVAVNEVPLGFGLGGAVGHARFAGFDAALGAAAAEVAAPAGAGIGGDRSEQVLVLPAEALDHAAAVRVAHDVDAAYVDGIRLLRPRDPLQDV